MKQRKTEKYKRKVGKQNEALYLNENFVKLVKLKHLKVCACVVVLQEIVHFKFDYIEFVCTLIQYFTIHYLCAV